MIGSSLGRHPLAVPAALTVLAVRTSSLAVPFRRPVLAAMVVIGVWGALWSGLIGVSHAASLDELIVEAAGRHQLPPELIRAIAEVESSLDPQAVSPTGAMGLMQLMPATAERFGVVDPFDPRQSLEGGCRYLSRLRQEFAGNAVLMLAAYNAGEGAVKRYDGVPPYRETRVYVHKVVAAWKGLSHPESDRFKKNRTIRRAQLARLMGSR